jgi:hypothetical protein
MGTSSTSFVSRAGIVVAASLCVALSGCDACKRTQDPPSLRVDASADAGVAQVASCTNFGSPTTLPLRDPEFGGARIEGDAVLLTVIARSEDGGFVSQVLRIDASGTLQVLASRPAMGFDSPPEWLQDAKRATWVERSARAFTLHTVGEADAGASLPMAKELARDSLFYQAIETPEAQLLVRTLPRAVEVLSLKSGAVLATVKTERPEQIVVRRIGEHVRMLWTAGALVDLDAGDYAEGPGELRAERWLETATVSLRGTEPSATTRVLPRAKHVVSFELLGQGAVLALESEQDVEGAGAQVLLSHVEHPAERERLAIGATEAFDRVPARGKPRVLYWSAHHEAYLSAVGGAPHANDAGASDAGAWTPERFEKLDNGRGLALLPDGRWLVMRAFGGTNTLQFLRCEP